MRQDRRCCKRLLQGFKCLVSFQIPLQFVFASQSSQWSSNLGIVMDEDSVEVCKTEKALYVSNGSRFHPINDCLNLLWVHGYTFPRNDVAQKSTWGWWKDTFSPIWRRVPQRVASPIPTGHGWCDLLRSWRKSVCRRGSRQQNHPETPGICHSSNVEKWQVRW